MNDPELTPDLLLRGYAAGIFPMAESRDDDGVFWVDPRDRGIIPLTGFHMSRSLRRRMRSGAFTASVDTAFPDVLDGCADRDETWINPLLRDLYGALFVSGHAHSVEVWSGPALVGGVYGVSLGRAFFGESMFSRETDASKAALAWLIDILRQNGFMLFDVQFLTSHLASLGAVEIPRDSYRQILASALEDDATFPPRGPLDRAQAVVQRITQTS